ncbi:MAG: TIGR03564 family F420-dependent LLM class oxidoreductase [Acidimicrobiia bacterium]|nr:TIGR03564 family F420-dependent LLM class oxidoreductase [Acidimicrobiia bacterium]
MKIGINGSGLLTRPDLEALVADIGRAEAAGLSSYWLAQTGLVDALTVFAVAGATTSEIELATAVVPTWPRHPQALAAQALTTQSATGGRTILGIGLAHRPTVEERWKLTWEKPIRHMLDYLGVLQELLATGTSSYEGEVWSFVGEAPLPTTEPPKVMLAALGDQMLRIAGRRTDGTILWCVGPKTLERQIVPGIRSAAADAGRPEPAIVCSLPVWVTDRADEAREMVARSLTIYGELPSYRAMLDIEGVAGPADISLIGTENQVGEGLAEIAAAGATHFTAVVQGFDDDERDRAWQLLTTG